jgi:hypothetical protein
MTWVAAAVAGGSVVSGIIGGSAAKDAARQQAKAIKKAAQIQERMFQQGRADLAPYREEGYAALEDIAALKPFLTAQFGEDQFAQYLDPSMAFRQKLGTQATERLANVGGGAVSGNTLRALEEFGQNLASTEYGNAFNRFQTERGNIYNTLANIAGMGQGAVNTGVGLGQQTAQNLGTLAVGQGQAQAAGTIGQANAYQSALQGPMNYLQLAALTGRNPFTPTPPVTPPGGIGPSQAGMPMPINANVA